jgi:hypothetical protein
MGHHRKGSCSQDGHPIGTTLYGLLKDDEASRNSPLNDDASIHADRSEAGRRLGAGLKFIIGEIVVFGAQHHSSDPWMGGERECRREWARLGGQDLCVWATLNDRVFGDLEEAGGVHIRYLVEPLLAGRYEILR